MLLVAALLGAFVAGALTTLVSRQGVRRGVRFWALGLVIAAVIYIGFALRAPASSMLEVEAAGVGIYGVLALLGAMRSPWYLAVGWLAHIAWDIFQPAYAREFVPAWYPPACAGFDLVVAVWLARAIRNAANTFTTPAE